MKSLIYLLLALFLLGGCAAYKSVHYGQDYSPPTDAGDIEILSFIPGRPYIELGEVTLFGVTPTNKAHMLNRLKDMVAEMGGEAVIIEEPETPIYMPRPIRGLVIKWQQDQVLKSGESESEIISYEYKDQDLSEEIIFEKEVFEYIK
jgi:hypothetical protein